VFPLLALVPGALDEYYCDGSGAFLNSELHASGPEPCQRNTTQAHIQHIPVQASEQETSPSPVPCEHDIQLYHSQVAAKLSPEDMSVYRFPWRQLQDISGTAAVLPSR